MKEESLKVLKEEEPYEKEELSSAFNCMPYIGEIGEDGFSEEEVKIMTETRKILNLPKLPVSAWTVRVPCLNSHSEVLRVSLKNPAQSPEDILNSLSSFVKTKPEIPHARQASGKKGVFVGRIHKDSFGENSWLLWIVADNLLKGASENGLQIARELWKLKT